MNWHDFVMMRVSFLHKCPCSAACSVLPTLLCFPGWVHVLQLWLCAVHFPGAGKTIATSLNNYVLAVPAITCYRAYTRGGKGSLSPFYRPGNQSVAFNSNFPPDRLKNVRIGERPTSLQLAFHPLAFVTAFLPPLILPPAALCPPTGVTENDPSRAKCFLRSQIQILQQTMRAISLILECDFAMCDVL